MRKVATMAEINNASKSYWHETLRLLGIILAIWAFVSLGLSIVFADTLNKIRLFGYPLGFWFAQQGSIYVFVALIFIYAVIVAKIDEKYDVHEN
jgi:putative solute:sodium symporter small subunit